MKKNVFLFVVCATIAFTACVKKVEKPLPNCPLPAPLEDDSITMVDSAIANGGEEKVDAVIEEATKVDAVKKETLSIETAPAEKVEK